jgi:hypothetical protein
MPFKIVKEKGGYFVKDKAGHKFSNRPLAKDVALRQRVAIAISEHKKKPSIPMKHYFI